MLGSGGTFQVGGPCWRLPGIVEWVSAFEQAAGGCDENFGLKGRYRTYAINLQSFFKDLSNKPSLVGALVQEPGELPFQQAHLVIFQLQDWRFSQNWLIELKFCL